MRIRVIRSELQRFLVGWTISTGVNSIVRNGGLLERETSLEMIETVR